MAKEEAFHHRSTLKQKHKPFKRRFATKNSLRDKSKGRTQRASIKGKVQRKHTRADRRNAVRTEQRNKREQILMSTRIFSGRYRAPKIVAVIPLCSNTNTQSLVKSLFDSVEEPFEGSPLLKVSRFKQTLQLVQVKRNLLDILDVAKVADYMVMGMSADVEVDEFGEHCLSAIQNQGHAAVFPVVHGLDQVAAKRRNDVRKSLQSFIGHFFPDAEKVISSDSTTELLALLRMLTSQVPKSIRWRDTRPYMLADNVEFSPSSENPQVGHLALTGYLRGANLSANRLIHIPSYGDFQIEQIDNVPVPMERAKGNEIEQDNDPVVLDRPTAEQDSLVASNEPNQLNNEQTWPEDEEMDGWKQQMAKMEEEEEQMARDGERTLRVPKGTSAYQAAWIADNEESDMSDSDEDMDDYSDVSSTGADEDAEEYEDIRIDAAGNPLEDEDEGEDEPTEDENLLSAEEEAAQLKAYLKEREQQNRDDLQFPDEVDTPMDQLARERFARFRGLQSFRTSPWDPYENLPLDYARIFQFENFKRTQQRIVRMCADAPAKAGMHVRIVLKQVPVQASLCFTKDRPYVVFGLHQYEHQMSVVHFTVTRNPEYTEPVRSKDPMVVHFGFRRYNVRPLYSQHLHGGATVNNVHKFERFLKPGEVSVGTVFAPIQFGTVPVSLYLPSSKGALPTLVGTGSSLEVNPSRILAKRVILTGAPFKIHRRSAVIRYMFFNPEDVNWFKPIQLYTKYGRVGHIKESLGTHGYMKCMFDGPIKQMDTVCMNLYKRVFPKWNTSLWSEHEQTDEQAQQWVGPAAEDVAMEI
ncbi:ribosome biogenesis protein tsr1 [Coemansia sp. RSA 2336]|nr:ribosome biogenesis protein tsr1 [Coemansia sp. RSA 2336]